MSENTIEVLEAVHRDLVERFEAGDRALEAIVESVPQLASLVERFVPEAHAAILTRAETRALVTEVVKAVVEVQAARCESRRVPARLTAID